MGRARDLSATNGYIFVGSMAFVVLLTWSPLCVKGALLGDKWLTRCDDFKHMIFTMCVFAVPVVGLLGNIFQVCRGQQQHHHQDTILLSIVIEFASFATMWAF